MYQESSLYVDTSCILLWLIEEGYEVIAYMADVGQEEVSRSALEENLPMSPEISEPSSILTYRTSKLRGPRP